MQQQMSKLSILPNYSIDIEITYNPHNFALTDLFRMAARINKKRQFLFVSTVLGKHLAVRPQIPLLTGTLLAMMYQQHLTGQKVMASSIVKALKDGANLDVVQKSIEGTLELTDETLFIGFAETAKHLDTQYLMPFTRMLCISTQHVKCCPILSHLLRLRKNIHMRQAIEFIRRNQNFYCKLSALC